MDGKVRACRHNNPLGLCEECLLNGDIPEDEQDQVSEYLGLLNDLKENALGKRRYLGNSHPIPDGRQVFTPRPLSRRAQGRRAKRG